LQFTWDQRKDRINQRKHNISFETAAFDDPHHVSRLERKVDGELRWRTIGMVRGTPVPLVAHAVTESGDEEIVHIISARKATPQERRI
jgi:uncharacterized protein